jgi:uncharacterized small protein (DUF1192 family)
MQACSGVPQHTVELQERVCKLEAELKDLEAQLNPKPKGGHGH